MLLHVRSGDDQRDTIAVGALRIVTDPSPLPVRAAAERAWPVLDSLYGAVGYLGVLIAMAIVGVALVAVVVFVFLR